MTRSYNASEFRAASGRRGTWPARSVLRPGLARRPFGAALFGLCSLLPSVALSQTAWNSPRTLALVRTAVDRRSAQLADTGLVAYDATAHGYLTFLVQLGRGFPTPPKIVRTDQLALEVYWHAPDLSKQLIIGRRDTTLLPTDIAYHRDHLGIIQNNFPNIIRLGEGDEVRDVPHPLSTVGVAQYDYAITDSLRMTIPGQTIDVYEVKVRPKDDAQPRVVGAVYIDRHTGQVVRMAFSFTRAALRDPQLEDISIVLENGLIGTKYWLPRHQEIEIRRTGTWLDYPVRGIIRGRWEVSDYHLNEKIPVGMFSGPEFAQDPPQVLAEYPWHGNILDSLPPDVTVTTDADVRRVQAEARALVREAALQRAEATRLSARGLSDFASVNRVQGLTLGAGLERPLGTHLKASVRPQYGIADAVVRGTASLDWQDAGGLGVHLFAAHTLADARDEPERSRIENSLAAQEFGSDATEPYDLRALGANVTLPAIGVQWTLGVAREQQRGVTIHARPAVGTYAPTIPVVPLDPWHVSLRGERATPLSWSGFDVRASVQLDWWHATVANSCSGPGLVACALPASTVRRASAIVDVARDVGPIQMVSHTHATVADGAGGYVPAQELAYFGGPVTAPGYALHGLVGTRGVSQRIELRAPIPFFGFPLGTFGHAPASATLAPYVNVVALPFSSAFSENLGNGVGREQRVFPSVGVGLISFFDLVRLDVARGLKSGGRWTFSVDITREFWPIL